MWSETERLLVHRWLLLLQRERGQYTVDTRHLCYGERWITRPFEWQPHFYGCVRCGQYHFCRASDCPTLPLAQELTCAFSGRVLGRRGFEPGSHEDEMLAKDGGGVVEHYQGGITRNAFRAKRTLYSNSSLPRLPGPLRVEEEEEEDDGRLVKKMSRSRRTQEEEPDAWPAERDVALCAHSDTDYWTAYYTEVLGPAPPRPSTGGPSPSSPKERVLPHVAEREELGRHTRLLIGELLRAQLAMQHRTLGRTTRGAIVERVASELDFAVGQLARLAPSLKPIEVVEAVLLRLLTERLIVVDSLGNNLCAWRPHPWLRQLSQSGAFTGARPPTRVKEAERVIRAALGATDPLWLVRFLRLSA